MALSLRVCGGTYAQGSNPDSTQGQEAKERGWAMAPQSPSRATPKDRRPPSKPLHVKIPPPPSSAKLGTMGPVGTFIAQTRAVADPGWGVPLSWHQALSPAVTPDLSSLAAPSLGLPGDSEAIASCVWAPARHCPQLLSQGFKAPQEVAGGLWGSASALPLTSPNIKLFPPAGR